MRRQRPLNEPVELNSPQEDLREISMLQDEDNGNIDNFKTQPKQIKAYGMLDGWIKFQHLNEKKNHQIKSNQSQIYERNNSNEKNQKSEKRNLSSRLLQNRKNQHDQNIQQNRPISSKQAIRKAKSQDFTQIQSPFISQNLPSINKNANLLQNYFFIKKITSQPKIAHQWSPYPRKVSVEAVSYPIIEVSANPQKRLVPHIGRIRHMLNLNNKRKQ